MKKETEQNYTMKAAAFLPFLILLLIPLANMIYNAIAGLPQSENYLPTLAIVTVPAVFSIFYGKGTVKEKSEAFCSSAANSSIIMMVLIFVLAGAFTSVSKEMGGIDSVVNLCLRFLPANMVYAGVFLVSALISISIGTSVGTITAMAAVAVGMTTQVGLNDSIGLSAVIGGAVFGDNLSMISDTTIAAVRGLGCDMKDKFRMNFWIILPAVVVAFVIYALLGSSASGSEVAAGEFHIVKILPYLFILVASLAGVNVIVVLSSGICLSGLIGILCGDYTLVTLVKSISSGVSGMATVTFSVLLAAGMVGVIRFHGGVDWLLKKVSENVHSRRGAEYMMAAMSVIMSLLLSGTSAIVIACPLVKPIAERYGITPKRSAAILDLFATQTTAFIFWAGLAVIASNVAGAGTPMEIVRWAVYPLLALICGIVSIQFRLFPGARQEKG